MGCKEGCFNFLLNEDRILEKEMQCKQPLSLDLIDTVSCLQRKEWCVLELAFLFFDSPVFIHSH